MQQRGTSLTSKASHERRHTINVLAEQHGCGYIDHEGEAFRAAVSKQGDSA